jgi:signal transduction histidine kinase
MKHGVLSAAKSPLPLILTVAMSIIVMGLAFYGYRAAQESRRSAIALADRAAHESAELLVAALTHDMRGAQSLVLANRDIGDFSIQSSADSSNQIATAFTRFPYPESFFGWRNGDSGLLLFNRGDRAPPWVEVKTDGPLYPVVVLRKAPFEEMLLQQIRRDALSRRTYTYLETTIVRDPYQIVARLQYSDSFRSELSSVTGFTVNLSWVRQWYFPEIAAQVARIGQTGINLDFSILDESGQPVVGRIGDGGGITRDLPLQFFDPWTFDLDPRHSTRAAIWKVRVSAANDPNLIIAERGADWTLIVSSITALALAFSFLLMAYAVRSSASLAAMRAEFVATVTHDLKTPLATIRAVADTMIRRPLDTHTVRKYAAMLVEESRRLSRLVDNLLAYARVTDVTEIYVFDRVAPAEVIEDALSGFRQQLTDGGFHVAVDIPHDLPQVRGDRTSLRLALDNLIDNAIRYSQERRWIHITARRVDSRVVIEVQDRGVGIPLAEIEAVQRKFVRGRQAISGGSGLGLPIVQRVVTDHSGRLTLQSEVGIGTTASFDIPIHPD